MKSFSMISIFVSFIIAFFSSSLVKAAPLTTSSPTSAPTFGFFGPNQPSLPFGSVQAFDLYLLIDTTRDYERIDVYCKKYRLMSGSFASSCFDLMMDYAIEIVKSISSSIGYYSDNLSKGLRVQASLIRCVATERNPASTRLFELTGDSSTIMDALNNARTNTVLTQTFTCPLQGAYEAIEEIETTWITSDPRPYKAIITLTNGVVHDANGNAGRALINGISGIRYRCTPSVVVVPYKMTDTSPQALTQQLSLKILTGNIAQSVFEGKVRGQVTIPNIGNQITQLMTSSTSRCSSASSFSTADKYWCGYNTPATCNTRQSCNFLGGGQGCRKIAAQSGCIYGDETTCIADGDCEWKVSSTCGRKPEMPDCNALFTQTYCNSRSTFCEWDGSSCQKKR